MKWIIQESDASPEAPDEGTSSCLPTIFLVALVYLLLVVATPMPPFHGVNL